MRDLSWIRAANMTPQERDRQATYGLETWVGDAAGWESRLTGDESNDADAIAFRRARMIRKQHEDFWWPLHDAARSLVESLEAMGVPQGIVNDVCKLKNVLNLTKEEGGVE